MAEDFLKIDKKLYFVSKDINIIFNLNLDTGKIEFVDCFPDESIDEKNLCYKILIWKNELIFVPMNAKKIWKYDIRNKKWNGIGLGKYENVKNKSFQAFIYDNHLFMVGCGYPAIFQLNLETNQILVIEDPFKHLNKGKCSISKIFFRYNFVQKREKIFMASCQDNSVMEFNLHDQSIVFHKIGNKKNKYSGIAWDGNDFWISPRDKTSIVKWNGKTEVVEYALPYSKLEEEIGFLGVINTRYGILFYGKKQNSILIVRQEKEINIQIIPKTYIFLKNEENSIYGLDAYGNLTIKDDKKEKNFQLTADKICLQNFLIKRGNNCNINYSKSRCESPFLELNDMINNVLQLKLSEISENEKTGSNIWNILK